MQAPCPWFRDFSGAETKNRPMSSRSRTDAASCREECAPPWRCGVVILNYNGSQDTIACLESLLRGSTLPSWVVIVDNASTDGSPEHLQQWAASATGQRMPEVGEAAPRRPPAVLCCCAPGKTGGTRRATIWPCACSWPGALTPYGC